MVQKEPSSKSQDSLPQNHIPVEPLALPDQRRLLPVEAASSGDWESALAEDMYAFKIEGETVRLPKTKPGHCMDNFRGHFQGLYRAQSGQFFSF